MTTAASGALLFARYAYPPNALGYCGPADATAVLELGTAATAPPDLAHLLRGFDGAWPYLELIAGANGIDDPLDHRVVEAYWVGNRHLLAVPAPATVALLEERFRPMAGPRWPGMADGLPDRLLPHHDLHVFAVSPWVGMLRDGLVVEPLRILDHCRISWGRISRVDGDLAVVASRRLAWSGSALTLGPPTPVVAQVAAGGRRFVGRLAAGDLVTLHWDWVCDRVRPRQVVGLARLTRRLLVAVDHAVARGAPAVA